MEILHVDSDLKVREAEQSKAKAAADVANATDPDQEEARRLLAANEKPGEVSQ